MSANAYLATLVIEGIQKYICSTGKLKEMIGGSAIINYIASPDFYNPLLAELGLSENDADAPSKDKYIITQANAGALRLIVFERELAENFLLRASLTLLARFPGLPFYTAVTEFAWPDGEAYEKSIDEANKAIANRRNNAPVPRGSPLLPILRVARLDGLPAVDREEEYFSLPSQARRDPDTLKRSREELQKIVKAPTGLELVWEENLEKMLPDEADKVALVCMDGNDLGKLFGEKRERVKNLPLPERLRAMKEFSETIQKCNLGAFAYACQKLIVYELQFRARKNPDTNPAKLVMPLRPLVMGGDDITLIVRADIALAFVEWFTEKFMDAGKEHRLSLGIGMVIMPISYPFAKAFPLAESLQDSAKKLTKHLNPGERPSSIDYLVLTEDVENNMQAVRKRLFVSASEFLLTGKPLFLNEQSLRKLIIDGNDVLAKLPRSQIRPAWTSCRKGPKEVELVWRNLRENIARGLGGRNDKLLDITRFEEIFPGNFFFKDEKDQFRTFLGDYLELEHMLPKTEDERKLLFPFLEREER